jgi:hypothetical protein
MEILRVPPYPITTTWDVPDPNAAYTIYVEDVVDHSTETLSVTSNSNSQVTYTIPRSRVQFDRDFLFRIYDIDLDGEIVVDDNLTIYRPYVNPNILATTASEIAEYKKWEIVARGIIDAYLENDSANGEGFYNHKLIVEGVGQGNDYFPMWHNPKKILKVYENNTLVYNGEDANIKITSFYDSNPTLNDSLGLTVAKAQDYIVGDMVYITIPTENIDGTYYITEIINTTSFRINTKLKTVVGWTTPTGGTSKRVWDQNFVITPNNSAIIRVESGIYNRLEQAPASFPSAVGDLGFYGYNAIAFPKGYDYIFILDVGYKAVPPDVEIAATMLIEDLKCGNNDYYKRFVTEYNTDQFTIKYASQFLGGTGNNVVDKILDGYKGNVIKPGLL